VIAQQFAVDTTPWVAWQHENPITGDALNTMSDGDDIISTVVEQAAQAIINTVGK